MVNISDFINVLNISWLRRVVQSSENVEWYSLSKIDFHKLLSCGSGYSIDLSKNLSNPFWNDCLILGQNSVMYAKRNQLNKFFAHHFVSTII